MPEKEENLAEERVQRSRSVRKDEILLDATDVARRAAEDISRPDSVGEHVRAEMIDKGVASHRFTCTDAGYSGWQWDVTVARAPRTKTVTVCEVTLTPGVGALLAPEWVPWENRLRPEDVARDDVLPYSANDSRLISGFEQTDEQTADAVGIEEMGLGRARVLSPEGIKLAAERWYASDMGPVKNVKPSQTCSTCGFFLKLNGSLGRVFGVCANEWSPDDGRIVSMDHSCGAHSETDEERRKPQWPLSSSRLDDLQIEVDQLRD